MCVCLLNAVVQLNQPLACPANLTDLPDKHATCPCETVLFLEKWFQLLQ